MPMFAKKFTKLQLKPRESRLSTAPKLTEEVDDFKRIELKLSNDKSLTFVNGVWINLKKNEDLDDVTKTLKKNQKLQEQNIMLNAKIEILLDLLTEAVCENESRV
ncbi:CLUMA_CG010740, isoform A [Clunio marinus]|uniref:CLUMA_CG010740, isoform A n=1 Tax=Clunio marinus TaxID=568069 RepID=A0A1J1IAN0_9DIPT|nr:CLUMA_CG010740, isoform A [Clunio marinus]